jgi:hypothetical protein
MVPVMALLQIKRFFAEVIIPIIMAGKPGTREQKRAAYVHTYTSLRTQIRDRIL